jgi:antitoxin component of MazEF toxin-antitoxin module
MAKRKLTEDTAVPVNLDGQEQITVEPVSRQEVAERMEAEEGGA